MHSLKYNVYTVRLELDKSTCVRRVSSTFRFYNTMPILRNNSSAAYLSIKVTL